MVATSSWVSDKNWADQFVPSAKMWLAQALFVVSSTKLDREQATDLIMLDVKGGDRIAMRIRRGHHLRPFGTDITFRLARPSGQATEFEKILQGFGDWFLYGFGDESSGIIIAHKLIDLRAFRTSWHAGQIKYKDQRNHDGSSSFRAIDTTCLPPGVMTRKHILPGIRCARRPPWSITFPDRDALTRQLRMYV